MITADKIISNISNSDLKAWFTNAITATALPSIEGAELLREMINAFYLAQIAHNSGDGVDNPLSTISEPNVQNDTTNEGDGTVSKRETWNIILKQVFTPDGYKNSVA